ncbi:GntR family transcriptional regulator [Jingyaoa shaoxingensis]|uniref:GntR family transcriptional regulator n=1 Tax=Jingyaoa shaoxingensis TaxID=2763671 RepID=A0ABR7N9T1_9FIRM|nr:GntR family transcriptional regulator [Jingyaoa shaoxingensis]MBC8573143.1 GntR family transcriptional regulator [Jingyaoa shaoxingensis]
MKPLNEQAYDHLQKLITDGQLSYHEIYSETKLAKELGISRTPFRDAIHRLAQEGYIDIIPSKGFRLHQITERDVIETFQIRTALETYCTMQIARDVKEKNNANLRPFFKELDWLMENMKEVMENDQGIDEFCEYDFRFHRKIIDYLENEQFSSVFASFLYRMKRLAKLSLQHEGRMAQTVEEHQAILDAMKNGDTEHIYEITMVHMDRPRGINLEDL